MSKIGNIYKSNGQAGNVYGINDVAPCVPGFSAGGGKEMKVLIKQATKQGYALCDVGGWQISVTPTAKQGEEECKEMDRYVRL